jgi:thiamine-monophosphate kinase
MIDISDGLSSELLHIAKQSNVGCLIHEEKIPVHDETRATAFEFGLDPTTCALNGGEDYELLFTVSQNEYEKLTGNEQISVVGYVTDPSEGVYLQTKQGNRHKLVAQGWNAFS